MTKVRRTLSCWFFFLFNVYVEWKFPLTFYTLHASRTLFYSEFANPIEFGNEISADQKSIILKLAEHIFGRFWIKYINLIVFTATQSCSFWKCWNMSHILFGVMFVAYPESSLRMMNQLRKVSSILLQPRLKLSGDKRCFVGI